MANSREIPVGLSRATVPCELTTTCGEEPSSWITEATFASASATPAATGYATYTELTPSSAGTKVRRSCMLPPSSAPRTDAAARHARRRCARPPGRYGRRPSGVRSAGPRCPHGDQSPRKSRQAPEGYACSLVYPWSSLLEITHVRVGYRFGQM